RELPCAELLVIPDCGHLPQEEQPEAFVRGVQAFVGGLR
ncbi:MAG: alpha/beta hydrolase, partial [Chlorobiaceae bacterium]|nr:alpha/beta hydrolase [Chlorobiaceae bacterium]